MSDSLSETPRADLAADVGGMPTMTNTPRRVMRARREAAEALGLAFQGHVPGWTVAPTPDYGSAVPLEDATLEATSPR